MDLSKKLKNRTTRLTGLSPGVTARESGPGRRDGETLLVPPKSIVPDPDQPRKTFDETGLASLAASLKEHGVINPLTVREEPDGTIRLIAGERRLRAAHLAGLETVPCRFDQSHDTALLQLVENVQRQDLNPIEEAEAYVRLKELGYTLERVGRLVGRSKSLVSETAALAALPENIKASARRQPDKFPKRLLIDLSRQKDPAVQAGLAERVQTEGIKSDQIKSEARQERRAAEQRPEPAPPAEPEPEPARDPLHARPGRIIDAFEAARTLRDRLARLDKEVLATAWPDRWEELMQELNELYRLIEEFED